MVLVITIYSILTSYDEHVTYKIVSSSTSFVNMLFSLVSVMGRTSLRKSSMFTESVISQ